MLSQVMKSEVGVCVECKIEDEIFFSCCKMEKVEKMKYFRKCVNFVSGYY